MKIIWLSRHDMTHAQEMRLLQLLPERERTKARIECHVQAWHATADENGDNASNVQAWELLFGQADMVVGIFPPVALIALDIIRKRQQGQDLPPVYTPISVVDIVIVNGEKNKRFNFLRWQRI